MALFYQPNDIDVGLLQTISGKLEYPDVQIRHKTVQQL